MSSPSILVVDDDALNRELVGAYLMLGGYHVMNANSGVRALEMIEKHIPACVLLDIRLPDLSGIEVCQKIRSLSQTKHIPIIMITGYVEQEIHDAGMAAGADAFLPRPFSSQELLAEIEGLIGTAS